VSIGVRMLRLFERVGSAKRLLISHASYAAKEMSLMSKSNITVRTLDWLKTHLRTHLYPEIFDSPISGH
jgi:hypothetical protein